MPAEGPAAMAVVFDGSPAVDDIANFQAGVRHLSAKSGARHAPEQLTFLLTPQL